MGLVSGILGLSCRDLAHIEYDRDDPLFPLQMDRVQSFLRDKLESKQVMSKSRFCLTIQFESYTWNPPIGPGSIQQDLPKMSDFFDRTLL